MSLGRWLSIFRIGLTELIYPNTCWVCGRLLPECPGSVCPSCAHVLCSDSKETCPRCCNEVGPHVASAEGCPQCRNTALAYDGVLRMGPYDGLLQEVVLRLKNSREETLAEVIGGIWANHMLPRLRQLAPHAVVPVPLHWTRRYWERGFNQSEVLAGCLARALRIPCFPRCLRRLRRTPRQAYLDDAAARRANVRGAFQARQGYDVADKTMLLVDDVLTTGATANEAARALRVLRPARIVVVVLAHG